MVFDPGAVEAIQEAIRQLELEDRIDLLDWLMAQVEIDQELRSEKDGEDECK